MKNCIFCKIIKGEVPCHKVYEDKDFLGFLDIRPLNPGHTLIIPKKHYRWVDDVPNFGEYFEVVKKVGLAIKETLSPKFVNYLTFGVDVPHAHVHILPRFENDDQVGIDWKNIKNIPEEKMREIAENIRERVRKTLKH